jgi:hypothetical protein
MTCKGKEMVFSAFTHMRGHALQAFPLFQVSAMEPTTSHHMRLWAPWHRRVNGINKAARLFALLLRRTTHGSRRAVRCLLPIPNATHTAWSRGQCQFPSVDDLYTLASCPLHSICAEMTAARHVQPLQLTSQCSNNRSDANTGDPRGRQVQAA